MTLATDRIRLWREDPVVFVREVLGAEPDAWQVDVLRAFVSNQRLALKACKGPGKSTVMAWCGWNFLLTRPHPKVVATSITGDNLRDGLWTEFAKWQAKSPLLKHAFAWSAERIVAKDHPETWWASARQWAKGADASQQANTLAGIHADYVLFLVDEAGGIPDGVVAAAEAGLSTGTETKLFLSGNPTHLSGPLYRACTRDRSLYWVKEISGDPDDPNRAPRIDIEWARRQIEQNGRDNPWVLVNVFGKFPPGQSNALLGVEDVTDACRRSISFADVEHEPKILGVDVARFGDDRTVFFPRQGRAGMGAKVFRNLNTMEVADQVALSIERWSPDAVFVDQTGVGAGVVDRLQQLGHNVTGVDNGSKALDHRFADRRCEMWWKMADWIRSGGCLPDDSELISELTAPTYEFDASNKFRLESKKELKKRGLASPDKADALALTFTAPVAPKMFAGLKRAHATTDYDPYATPEKRVETEYQPLDGGL